MFSTESRLLHIFANRSDKPGVWFNEYEFRVRIRKLDAKASIGEKAEMSAVSPEVHDQSWRFRKPAIKLPVKRMAKDILQTIDLKFTVKGERVRAKETHLASNKARKTTIEKSR